MLKIKPSSECQYDILSSGEVMLRFDPGKKRIRSTRNFQAWEGDGEYNVARGLRRCFNQRATLVAGIAKNEIGYLLEDSILQGDGDRFAADLFYGLMNDTEIQLSIEYGVAHGALAMTTPGDNSMVSLPEVEALIA